MGAIPSILEHLPVLAAGRWVGGQGRPPLYLDREAQGGLRGSQGCGGERDLEWKKGSPPIPCRSVLGPSVQPEVRSRARQNLLLGPGGCQLRWPLCPRLLPTLELRLISDTGAPSFGQNKTLAPDSPAGPSEEQGSLAGASPPGPSAVPLELRDSDPGQGPELWALSECLLLSSLPWLDLCSHPVAGWKQWSPV